jgi:AAA domain
VKQHPSPLRDDALGHYKCSYCGVNDGHDPSCPTQRCSDCGRPTDDIVSYGHFPRCSQYVRRRDDTWLGEAMREVERGGSDVYLVRASEIPSEDVDYLEEPLLPLRVPSLVTGLDGVGKSTILYNKGALATRGKLAGKFKGTPVDVVIASCEDHPGSVIRPRLVAAGADLDRVHIVKVRRDGLEGDIALPDDLDAVALEVARVDARLLIVDPLVAHMPLQVDSHKAQHVRSVLAPLARLAEERELAVAAVVHFNGSPSTDVRSRISGSKALRDAARSVLVCGIDPNDESRYVLVQDKHSFGPKSTTGRAYRIETKLIEDQGKTRKTSGVVWLGEVEIDSHGLLAGAGDPEERTERDEAGDFLDELLKAGDVAADDVLAEAKKAGIAEKTLRRAKRQRGVRSVKEGGHWVWKRREDGHTLEAGHLGHLEADEGVLGGHLDGGGHLESDAPDVCEQCGESDTTLTVVGRLCGPCANRVIGGRR